MELETAQTRRELLWNASLEEYKSLKSEVVAVLDRQYSMLYWAISSIAIMLAALSILGTTSSSHPFCRAEYERGTRHLLRRATLVCAARFCSEECASTGKLFHVSKLVSTPI